MDLGKIGDWLIAIVGGVGAVTAFVVGDILIADLVAAGRILDAVLMGALTLATTATCGFAACLAIARNK